MESRTLSGECAIASSRCASPAKTSLLLSRSACCARPRRNETQIREHLQGFTALYEGMAERLEEFVSLFPVHPAYLSVFEQITIVEKRTVLKTLSQEIATLLDHEVPAEETGLVCHDSYRARLAGDPSFRTIPEVKDVLDRSERLRFTVERGMADKQYVPTALRIIDGLAVHRLTTEDIRVPIGMTYEALRDDLCLLPPGLPKRDALFLQTTVTAIVKKIMTAVSGQFLTENPDNGQVYLDVDKDVDYDQKIEERAASLDDDRLDDAYFKALETVMERRDEPYVAGYRIWEYELPWTERNVTRRGYLFMGAPNERSTAQPPRDFYVYFLQPYAPPRFEDEERADETFFRLERPDDDFTAALRRYAGATALAVESTASHRPIYQDKADNALRAMVTWLRANMGKAVAVTNRGEGKPLDAWLGGSEGPRSSVKEQIDTIASRALTTHFDARYPDYPTFDAQVTRDNLAECVRQAISHVAGRPTALGARMLRSLDLLGQEDRVRADGRFASELLQRLDDAGGKVVNRADLLSERDPGVWTWGPWHLETAWLVVVGAALAQVGRLSLRIDGREIDALSLDVLTRMDISGLEAFTDVAPPRALPLVELRQVAELLGLPPGIIQDNGLEDAALREILSRVSSALERVALARDVLADTPQFWGAQLIESSDHRDNRVQELQKVLEDLGARNTVGRMSKLDLGQKRLDTAREGLAELEYFESVVAAREKLSGVASYLREAADVFGPETDESRDAARLRQDVLELLHADDPPDAHAVAELRRRGDEIRRAFAAAAARSYAHDHLDAEGDARKKALLDDERLTTLERLSAIPLLPGDRFAALREELVGIPSLLSFDERRLDRSVLPDSGDYQPGPVSGLSAAARLEDVERRVPRLLDEWTAALRDSLLAPEMADQIALLGPASADVEAFRDGRGLPAPLGKTFVASLHQVLDRFDVRNVTRDDMWNALFPEGAPATVQDLRERFAEFLNTQMGSAEAERVRVVPKEQDG